MTWIFIGLLILTLFVAARLVLRRLCGPVLAYELTRMARRQSTLLLRCSYAVILLFVLFGVYSSWFRPDYRLGFMTFFSPMALPPSDVSRFAHSFFWYFAVVQFLSMMLLTPALTAGSIAEQRQNGSLALLLSTQLTDREIILGIVLSRLLSLFSLLLAGLPVLAFLQFLGGIDPNRVLVSFFLTLCSTLTISALSMFNSTIADKPRSAIGTVYLQVFAFLFFSGLCITPMISLSRLSLFGLTCLGNPLLFWIALESQPFRPSMIWIELFFFALWHLGAIITFILLAIRRLRREAFPIHQQSHVIQPQVRTVGYGMRNTAAPPLFNRDPLLWKEEYFEHRGEKNSFYTFFVGVGLVINVAALLFVPVLFFAGANPLRLVGAFFLAFLRGGILIYSIVLWCILAIRSAGTISSERERHTFDGLLSLPVSREELLRAKWWGCLYSIRYGLLGVGLLFILPCLTGGLDLFNALCLVLLCLVQFAFIITLGMLCSLHMKSTWRATGVTLILTFIALGGHNVLSFCVMPFLSWFGEQTLRWFSHFQWVGLTAPVSLWTMAHPTLGADNANVGQVFLGMICQAGTTGLLWLILLIRFDRITGRH